MKITIDEIILNKYNITLDEFLVLYLKTKDVDIGTVTSNLIVKGFADKDKFANNKIVVSNNIKDLITTIIVDSDKNIINKDEEYIDLAIKLREVYPSGRKSGTSYMWRGTTAEVAKKLKTLVVKYGYSLDADKVLKVTKDYVDSFHGNYKYMPLLKYFILKSVMDADKNVEVKSELMSLLENEDQIDEEKNDWVGSMV